MPHSTAMVENPDQSGYSWIKSDNGSGKMTRKFANLERMFVIFNRNLHGQNCPLVGANISLQGREYSSKIKPFNISQLHARAVKAFCQTRWRYPTVAARVLDGDTASYNIESGDGIEQWADRTVFTICQDGGWIALRERLSREASLPSPDGDCCLFYVIVRPDETIKPEIQTFDILMHTHHAFTDGSGIRVVMNEFLERLASPLPDNEIAWGEETQRFEPAAIVLEKIEAAEDTAIPVVREEGSKAFHKMDIGLPVYRPDILAPKLEHKGTLFVSHTFEDSNFLPQLQSAGRKHGVKLTGLLHAAMLNAIHNLLDPKPGPEDVFYSGSPMDLRNGHLIPEYCDRAKYVNMAIAIQPIKVPCSMFETVEANKHGLWEAAACISNQWETIKLKKEIARTAESDAKTLIEAIAGNKNSAKPAKPRTCPTFASDPPGSQGLRGKYPLAGHEGLNLVLDSYQLATDQMQTVVSTRSHSWNGLLTLCVVFNAVRNPKVKMQEFLDKWVDIVARASKDNAVVDIPKEEIAIESSSLAIIGID